MVFHSEYVSTRVGILNYWGLHNRTRGLEFYKRVLKSGSFELKMYFYYDPSPNYTKPTGIRIS